MKRTEHKNSGQENNLELSVTSENLGILLSGLVEATKSVL